MVNRHCCIALRDLQLYTLNSKQALKPQVRASSGLINPFIIGNYHFLNSLQKYTYGKIVNWKQIAKS